MNSLSNRQSIDESSHVNTECTNQNYAQMERYVNYDRHNNVWKVKVPRLGNAKAKVHKNFSVKKYGNEKSYEMAVKYRDEILNSQKNSRDAQYHNDFENTNKFSDFSNLDYLDMKTNDEKIQDNNLCSKNFSVYNSSYQFNLKNESTLDDSKNNFKSNGTNINISFKRKRGRPPKRDLLYEKNKQIIFLSEHSPIDTSSSLIQQSCNSKYFPQPDNNLSPNFVSNDTTEIDLEQSVFYPLPSVTPLSPILNSSPSLKTPNKNSNLYFSPLQPDFGGLISFTPQKRSPLSSRENNSFSMDEKYEFCSSSLKESFIENDQSGHTNAISNQKILRRSERIRNDPYTTSENFGKLKNIKNITNSINSNNDIELIDVQNNSTIPDPSSLLSNLLGSEFKSPPPESDEALLIEAFFFIFSDLLLACISQQESSDYNKRRYDAAVTSILKSLFEAIPEATNSSPPSFLDNFELIKHISYCISERIIPSQTLLITQNKILETLCGINLDN